MKLITSALTLLLAGAATAADLPNLNGGVAGYCTVDGRNLNAIVMFTAADGVLSRDSTEPVKCSGYLLLDPSTTDGIITAIDATALNNILENSAYPTSFGDSSITLVLNENMIESIPANAFKGSDFTEINLDDNPLTGSFDPLAFAGMDSLTSLLMSRSMMTSLPTVALTGFNKKEMVNVVFSGSEKIVLADNGLDGVTLMGLNLDSCKITTITADLFKGLTCDNLVLSNNDIATINVDGFKNSLVAGLDMSYTKLEKSKLTNVFNGYTALKTLVLDGNNFNDGTVGMFSTLDLTSLSLQNTNMTSFPVGSLDCKVQKLNLNNNKIGAVQNVFSANVELTELKMDNCDIKTVDAAAFATLSALSELHLNRNAELTDTALVGRLDGLVLTVLSLNECAIASIAEDWLGKTSVEQLFLTANPITTVEVGAFATHKKLTLVKADQAQISALPAGLFSGQAALAEVDFSGNAELATIDNVFVSLTLKSLLLSRCAITAITAETFTDLTCGALDLSFNNIATVSSTMIGIKGLTDLKIGDNQIRSFPTDWFNNADGSLDGLTNLDMPRNELTIVKTGQFSGLKGLKELSFEGNSALSEIEVNSFTGMNMDTLLFDSCPIKYLNSGTFDDLTVGYLSFYDMGELTGFEVDTFKNVVIDKLEFGDCPFTGNVLPLIENEHITQYVFATCQLKEIPSSYFLGLPKVIRIILDSNDFPLFKKEWFADSNIIYIQSQFVNVQEIEEGFFEAAPAITGIVFNFNEFKQLTSETFANAPNLLYATMYNNTIYDVAIDAYDQVADAHRFYFDHTTYCEDMEGVFKYLNNATRRGTVNKRGEDVICTAPNKEQVTIAYTEDPCDSLTCCSKEVSNEAGKFYSFDIAADGCTLCDAVESCINYETCKCTQCGLGFNITEDNGCVRLEENFKNEGLDTKDKIIIGVCCGVGAIIIIVCVVFFGLKTKAKRDKLGGLTPSEFVNGGAQSAETLDSGAEYEKGGKKGDKKDEAMPDDGYVTPIVQ